MQNRWYLWIMFFAVAQRNKALGIDKPGKYIRVLNKGDIIVYISATNA